MRMNFDLIDLQLLANIAEEQSLTRGAERSFLSLSSASMRIKMFEETLGIKLLYRAKQGATLTPAGSAVVHRARIVLGELENLRDDLHAYGSGLKGSIRLFANATSISSSLPGLLETYLAQCPNVDVDLRERLSDDGAKAVVDGSADIAIVSGDTHTDGLEVFPYGSEELVLAVSNRHPLAKRARVAFSETLMYSYISLLEGSALHKFLVKQATALHTRPSIRIQVGSFDAICRMIETNVGIGILPITAARRYACVMDICILPLSDPWSVRDSKVCVRSLSMLPLFGQKLVQTLGGQSLALT